MAERKIEVKILGDERDLVRAFRSSSDAGRKFSVGVGTIVKSALVFEGVRQGVLALGAALRSGVSEWSEQVKVAAQTNAVIRSTRGIANVTAKAVDRLAGRISRLSGIDDEAIAAGSNLLLTFKNVRNELGAGNNIFDRATKSAVDLSVAGFGSISTTAKQMGKALNDPVRGITALRRAGVQFTSSQEAMIKKLVETGRILEAQKIVLREVESQVGGSARALGQTLPGQLNILRESIKNSLGGLVGTVAPALQRALTEVNDFVTDLSQARTIEAKFDIVVGRLQSLAGRIQERVAEAVGKINWTAIFDKAQGIADGLQAKLNEVDFGVVGEKIGQAFVDAVDTAVPAAKEMAQRVNEAVQSIDFEDLGKRLGPGLATAIVTAFVTLADPAFWIRNWDLALAVAATVFRGRILALGAKLVAPFGRLGAQMVGQLFTVINRELPKIGPLIIGILAKLPGLVAAAFRPLTGLVGRAFAKLGSLARFTIRVLGLTVAINAVVGFAKKVGSVFASIGSTIKDALEGVWNFIKRRALQAALNIIEPFTKIPGFLGGGAFRDLKTQWQASLNEMTGDAGVAARNIQGHIDGIRGKNVEVTVITRLKTIVENAVTPGGTTVKSGPGARNQRPQAVEQEAKRQAGEIAAAANAAAKAREAAAAAAKAAAARAARALQEAQDAFAALLGGLDLRELQASVTKSFADDLKVAQDREKAIRAQIRIEGRTNDLLTQLFNVEQQQAQILRDRAEARRTARQGDQFKALGLTGTGEERAPSAGALLKKQGSLLQQIKGTMLDTPKTRSMLQRIGKVLSGAFGKVGRDVRLAILAMLKDIDSALEGGQAKGRLTKFRVVNTDAILDGLGLSGDALKEARQRLARLGVGGTTPRPGGAGGAFGFEISGGSGVTINGPITVVANDPEAFLAQIERIGRRGSISRTGPRAGTIGGR